MNKKRKIILVISILFVLLLASIAALALTGRKTPLAGMITNVQSNQCKTLAHKLLNVKNATYPFHRCEQQRYKTADSNKSVTRVYVVAGTVERQWEFECGFNAECATYVGWFDENDNLFDFTEPPRVANHDPAVYTLGCGRVNSSSVNDIEVKPKVVFERGKYWWKIEYNSTPTNTQEQTCKVNGVSLVGYKETLSSVKAEYLFRTDNCQIDVPTPCQTALALKTKSAEPCKYELQEANSIQSKYDLECTSNYIAQTGDTALCGTEANYGKITCDNIVSVRQF
ncbi:MAG TPA: hypothetical protein VF733_07045 [Candidatus Saccharimonadales bacterium]